MSVFELLHCSIRLGGAGPQRAVTVFLDDPTLKAAQASERQSRSRRREELP